MNIKKVKEQIEISDCEDLFYVENSIQTDVTILIFMLKIFFALLPRKKESRKRILNLKKQD